MRSLIVVLAATGCLGAGISPAVSQQAVVADTVDASAHVYALIRSWHPDSGRAYCITSMATWPTYIYLRHMKRLFEVGGPEDCESPEIPMFLQLAECPESFRFQRWPAWVLVQCGPQRYRRYRPSVPRPSAGEPARLSST